jgi:hypothetical protein
MDEARPLRYPDIYHPLPPGFTRVLELEAGHFTDPIFGRLVVQAIDGEPYEAVSYVWGDVRKRHDITIDGVKLSIAANLHGALTAFRPLPHGPQSGSSDGTKPGASPAKMARRQVRRLWADAVCINQQDLPERTAQVELMGRIFAGARCVLAWLGWEQGEVGRRYAQAAIRYIHSFMEDPMAGLLDARILLHHDVADPVETLTHLSEDDRRQVEEQARNWEAIKVFFQTEYFHRTWIVQELGLAREAILYTAINPADGTEAVEDDGANESKNTVMELDFIDWPLVGRFVKFLDDSAASLVTHLGLLSWVANHIMMVWELEEDGTHKSDFLTGIHWVRTLRVTDARDRVYSLLGHPLAVLDGELVIKPEYTCTRGVAYTKLATNFIRKTKNLHAVSFVDHEDDPSVETRDWDPQDDGRMPSWVPDWHSINRTTPMNYSVDAAEPEDPHIQVVGDGHGVKGTPLPHLLVRGCVVDEISAVSRRMETTDFPVTHLTREQAKTNPFWLDRIWELVFPAEGSTDRNALAVLDSLSLALTLGTQQTLEEHQRSFAAYVLDYHELRHTASEAGGVNEDGYLPARSLYDSLPAEAQAELRRRGEGTTSVGFLERMTWPSMCRVMYRTASGLVGMGSRVTRPGDLVCRVRGSSLLMTLRPIKESSTGQAAETDTGTDAAPISCAHIGPTVIPARMEKNVINIREYSEKAAYFRII